MLSQLLSFENEVLASTSISSLILISGDKAITRSVTKVYSCDSGAEYTFFIVVVMFTLLGFKYIKGGSNNSDKLICTLSRVYFC